jgi:DNA-binding Lrp family transcriptional regulator
MDDLLHLLRKNAAETPAALARMLNVGEEEVRRRIAECERTGLIRGYKAVIDDEQLGDGAVRAVIEVKITPEREGGFDHIAQRVSRFAEVDSLFLMSGGYDLLVFVKGETLREVAFFVSEKLATINGVVSTATHFMLKTYKDQGILLRPEEEHERLPVSP